MAARSAKTGRGATSKPALEDAARFSFEADPSPPRRGAAPQSEPAAPHFHKHRARLRERFDSAGPEALADYELLELMLFRIIPRRDTKPLAKALIARFGDVAAVLAAPAQRIAEVEGAGEAVARELKVAQAVLERAARAQVSERPLLGSWSQLVSYCMLTMAHAPREQFRVLFLDVKNRLIKDEVLNEGTINHAPVYPREIARRALELAAAAAILAHNHPSGDPTPSSADIAVTREIIEAARAVGVQVHDHLVIGRDGVVSLRNMGLI